MEDGHAEVLACRGGQIKRLKRLMKLLIEEPLGQVNRMRGNM